MNCLFSFMALQLRGFFIQFLRRENLLLPIDIDIGLSINEIVASSNKQEFELRPNLSTSPTPEISQLHKLRKLSTFSNIYIKLSFN